MSECLRHVVQVPDWHKLITVLEAGKQVRCPLLLGLLPASPELPQVHSCWSSSINQATCLVPTIWTAPPSPISSLPCGSLSPQKPPGDLAPRSSWGAVAWLVPHRKVPESVQARDPEVESNKEKDREVEVSFVRLNWDLFSGSGNNSNILPQSPISMSEACKHTCEIVCINILGYALLYVYIKTHIYYL